MDTETTSSLNSKYFLYMIKTTHLSDEPKKIEEDRRRYKEVEEYRRI